MGPFVSSNLFPAIHENCCVCRDNAKVCLDKNLKEFACCGWDYNVLLHWPESSRCRGSNNSN
jgi:hypothetical protein